jgi:hypothetical protein
MPVSFGVRFFEVYMPIETAIPGAIATARLIGDFVDKFSKKSDIAADIKQLNNELVAIQVNALSALNEAQFLVSRNRDLEAENATFKEWRNEASQYSPLEISLGIFVHARNDDMALMKSKQKLCSNCFNQGKKSLLQFQNVEARERSLVCHRCNHTVRFRSYLDET